MECRGVQRIQGRKNVRKSPPQPHSVSLEESIGALAIPSRQNHALMSGQGHVRGHEDPLDLDGYLRWELVSELFEVRPPLLLPFPLGAAVLTG